MIIASKIIFFLIMFVSLMAIFKFYNLSKESNGHKELVVALMFEHMGFFIVSTIRLIELHVQGLDLSLLSGFIIILLIIPLFKVMFL